MKSKLEGGGTAFKHLVGVAVILAAGLLPAWSRPVPDRADFTRPDPVAQKELAAPGDPAFDSVARYFSMMQFPHEAVGVPEGMGEFVVMTHGELAQSSSAPALVYFVLGTGASARRYGEGIKPDAKRLAEGYLPMVIVPDTFDGVEYRQTVFGWSEGMDPGARPWVYLGLEMKNTLTRPAKVNLAHQLAYGKPAPASVTSSAANVPAVYRPRAKSVLLGRWEFTLAPDERRRLCVRIPRDAIVPVTDERWSKALETVAPADYDTRFKEVAQTWQKLLDSGMRIRVPEARVNDAWRAWLAYTFLDVCKKDDLFLPYDGAGFYRSVFGIMATTYCRGLDVYGHSEKSRKYLASLLTLVQSDGEFKTAFGLGDTGWMLTALDHHYQYTRDRAWLDGVAPLIVKMGDWIIARRAKEMTGQDPTSSTYGLLKCRPSADYPAPDYSYITDTALCLGLESAARALKAAGKDGDSQRIGAAAAAYRTDISRSMERSVFKHEGVRLFPILPATHGWLKKANYGTHSYYSLFAATILETGFLAPGDWRALLIADGLEQRGGLTAGVSSFNAWGGKEGIDHAWAFGYWEHALQRNEPKKAILGFYGSLAYGMSRSTYSSVEVVRDIHAGINDLTLPHLRSGVQLLRLLRLMLVREDGDRLLLAQAAPRHWLKTGQRIEVLDAPTTFGKVSYTIESQADRGRITARLTPPRRDPPREIRLFVRHPEGKPIRGVSVAGKATETFDAGSVKLRDCTDPVTLELRY